MFLGSLKNKIYFAKVLTKLFSVYKSVFLDAYAMILFHIVFSQTESEIPVIIESFNNILLLRLI